MKKLIIILFLGSLALVNCQDITVGYLLSDNAEYPKDSMEIMNHSGVVKKLADLKEELELDLPDSDPELIEEEIAYLQTCLDENIPWATSMIDGVQGTQPLSYRLAMVKNDNGHAQKFTPFVTVSGGGRIHVSREVEVPAGRYLVSLYVENEGYSNLLEDIFTFIVK